ncbi:MAG: hypothetical protein AMXMBFR4_09970 [Candidatus Hydrogenedentota bacterium]
MSSCAAMFVCVAAAYADGAEKTSLTNAKAGVYVRDGLWVAPLQPPRIDPGPILFLDETLLESSSGIERIVCKPERDPAIPNPVVTGNEDGCFQPYLTGPRDADTGRFRLWYGRYTDDGDTVRSRIGYMESADGRGLSLSVDAKDGEARVAVTDADGNALEGLAFDDCIPVAVDALNAPVRWKKRPANGWEKTVRLEIALRNARLFAVNVE